MGKKKSLTLWSNDIDQSLTQRVWHGTQVELFPFLLYPPNLRCNSVAAIPLPWMKEWQHPKQDFTPLVTSWGCQDNLSQSPPKRGSLMSRGGRSNRYLLRLLTTQGFSLWVLRQLIRHYLLLCNFPTCCVVSLMSKKDLKAAHSADLV